MQKINSIMIIALMAFGLAACADVSHNNTTAEEAIVEETKENASSDETATTEETVSDETTIVEESNQSLQEPVSISAEKKRKSEVHCLMKTRLSPVMCKGCEL